MVPTFANVMVASTWDDPHGKSKLGQNGAEFSTEGFGGMTFCFRSDFCLGEPKAWFGLAKKEPFRRPLPVRRQSNGETT